MLRIGLYGTNGHQLPLTLPEGVRAKVVAVAAYPAQDAVTSYPLLDDLLADQAVDLVSLCSPRRIDQVADALRCLAAGKHVLAEKPGAFTDAQLDELLAAERRTGREFREMMGGSLLESNVRAMRELVDQGELGTIVHVQAQKSYPWVERRPRDFDTDGGLIRQAGIHATRFIIGATGLKITAVRAVATDLGCPDAKTMHMAAVLAMTLENGAVASLNINYLNPRNFGTWGNEHLRLHGTRGMAESVDGFTRHRLFLPDRESTELPPPSRPLSTNYLEHLVTHLLDGMPMPTDRAEELAALRAVIAAHQAALTGETVAVTR